MPDIFSHQGRLHAAMRVPRNFGQTLVRHAPTDVYEGTGHLHHADYFHFAARGIYDIGLRH